jgi:NADPH-dependent curcumin reductase CurA
MRRLTVYGLLVPDLISQFAQGFFTEVPALLSQGKIKTSYLVVEGLENADKALAQLFEGKNTGQLVVAVANE